jgi:hypothetical protein
VSDLSRGIPVVAFALANVLPAASGTALDLLCQLPRGPIQGLVVKVGGPSLAPPRLRLTLLHLPRVEAMTAAVVGKKTGRRLSWANTGLFAAREPQWLFAFLRRRLA